MPGIGRGKGPPRGRTAGASTITATAKPDKAKAKAVVPFKMLPTNHMLVEARINDKGPYHLIFDLGAVTLLSNRVARQRGLSRPAHRDRSCLECGVRPKSTSFRSAT